jgi:hypothetical protein
MDIIPPDDWRSVGMGGIKHPGLESSEFRWFNFTGKGKASRMSAWFWDQKPLDA